MKVIEICLVIFALVCWANARSYSEECDGDCSGYPYATKEISVHSRPMTTKDARVFQSSFVSTHAIYTIQTHRV